MPQVYIILGPATSALFTDDEVDTLGAQLALVVERGFDIEETEDTAFTAVRAVATGGEADIQVEIRYTAGGDEYGRGKPFEPSLQAQKKLADLIGEKVETFLRSQGLPAYSLSVWCKPYYGSLFVIRRQGCTCLIRKKTT